MANSTDIQTIAESLGAISGAEHLRADKDTIHIAPADAGQLAALLRCASESGISVGVRGGGTKQHWGHPCRPSVVLEMHRLNRFLEHTWQDMTCTVEAGSTWSSMQAELARHGQFVALDPLWPDSATVGGVVASNDSGALRLKYGGLRDLIIGMTIVLADGTIARTGGKVVKNVAGYDLHKLMIGAYGTLGVITAVTFRLHSLPRNVQNFTSGSAAIEPLGNLLAEIYDSHLSVQSLQLRSQENVFYLDVGLAALPEVVRDQAAALMQMADNSGLQLASSDDGVWKTRERIFDRPGFFAVKATMLTTEIARLTRLIDGLGGSSVTQATGIMTAALPAAALSRLPDLRETVAASGGALTILAQTGDAAATTPSSGVLPDTLPLMRELKTRFDPKRILNPGRFLGGI